ncbi:hypothetical protein HDU98_008952 [Podochytrium sp. JEL0797]|nr:hypothetical protein HDU98_008952 [Podochytrium sp. JEL0797]
MYAEGHEIADHTFSHPQWATAPEPPAMIAAATKYMGIPKDQIKGFRSPFLESSFALLSSAKAAGLLWHSSTDQLVEQSPWPYTMDYGFAYDCETGKDCTVPSKAIPGLWDIPMGVLYSDSTETSYTSMDPWFGSIAASVAALQYTFSVHHNNGKTPMGLWYHTWNSFGGDRATSLNQFITWAQSTYPDVWLVTASQLIAWMQNPVPLSKMNSFMPSCPAPSTPVLKNEYYCDGLDDNANGQVDEFVASVCSYPDYTQFRTCYGCPTTLYTVSNPAPAAGCSPMDEFFNKQTSCAPLPLTKHPGTPPAGAKSNPVYPSIPGWTFLNCFLDDQNARILPSAPTTFSPATIANCVQQCAAKGFLYAGAEFGSQCFCGSVMPALSLAVDSSHCEDPCQDDVTQICGGASYISVYANTGPIPVTKTTTSSQSSSSVSTTSKSPTSQSITSVATMSTSPKSTSSVTTSSMPSISGWTYSGCFLDPVNPRALSTEVYPTGKVTAQVCVAQCQAQGLPVAGMEYASECWCGMALPTSSSKACNMPCQGDATQELSPKYPGCNPTVCKPPACLCPSFNPPGNLSLAETPQFLLITFDDWIDAEAYQNASQVFNHVNPNGCPIKTTYFTQIVNSDPAYVTRLYAEGHEIADHTFSHPQWATAPEPPAMIAAATKYMGIPKDQIKGFRSPFLESSFALLSSARAAGLLYHSSTDQVVEQSPWPYTMDYGFAYDCQTGKDCTVPSKAIPGLWDIPMGELYSDSTETSYTSMDPWFGSVAASVAGLKYTFSVHHNNGKTPMGLWYHTWNDFGGDRATSLNQFITWAQSTYPDVWLVTASQLIAWMQNPVPLSKMNSFMPSCPAPSTPVLKNEYYCDGLDDNANGQVDEFVASVCSYPDYTQFRTCYGCPTTLYTVSNPAPAAGCSPMDEFFNKQTTCAPLPLTKNPGTPPTGAKSNPVYPSIPGWTFLNCFLDDQNARILPSAPTTFSPATIANCVQQCAAKGFLYAGAEFGSQCFCGSVMPALSLVVASSHCEDPCQDDATQVTSNSIFVPLEAVC